MTSETDSNSSLSEQERKLNKLHKKLKKKSGKKLKKEKKSRHEKKKYLRQDTRKSSDEDIQIQNTVLFQRKLETDIGNKEDIEIFGPALPPHLLNKKKAVDEMQTTVIGPIIPKDVLGNLKKESELQNLAKESISLELQSLRKSENEEDDLKYTYGPLPVTTESEMTPAQIELEQRALELKMAAIDGVNTASGIPKEREEWMLELPDVGLKTGLAALNNLKRGFHHGKEKPDFSDRSSWTKTPNSCQEKKKPTNSKEQLEVAAKELYEKQRDEEQKAIAKKHKREESLVEIHQKKLRAEEKRKAQELKESGAKPERRPFTRDIDLKLNKMDRNHTKQIVDKAKILNTKFASGHSKYL